MKTVKCLLIYVIMLMMASPVWAKDDLKRYRGYDYYKIFRDTPKFSKDLGSGQCRDTQGRRYRPASPYPTRTYRYIVEEYNHTTGKRERKTVDVRPVERY